jgi:hypothetical protein
MAAMGEAMNLFTANARYPYLLAYIALVPGCLLGGLGLLIYSLAAGPGAVDLSAILIAGVLVLVWSAYSFIVGVALVTFYALPMIWLLRRIDVGGPLPVFAMSVLPGIGMLLFGGNEYAKFSWFLLGFGASVGISYCAMAYRKMK